MSRLALTLVVLATTFAFGLLGALAGEGVGYAIAWASGRSTSELKDMMIWCIITTPLVGAALGFWLPLQMLSDRPWVKRTALAILLAALLLSGFLISVSYVEAPRLSSAKPADRASAAAAAGAERPVVWRASARARCNEGCRG